LEYILQQDKTMRYAFEEQVLQDRMMRFTYEVDFAAG